MLDLAAVLALAQQCAPQVAPQTLAAVAWTESRFDPLAIGVNAGPRPADRPSTTDQAIREAERRIATGGNIDLGLAQINSANLAWLGLSVADAFQPCRNLDAAAKVLRAGYRPASNRLDHRQTALRIALSRYNTGDPRRGFANGYVAKVERAIADLGLTQRGPIDQSAAGSTGDARVGAGSTTEIAPALLLASAPPPAPAPWDVFARARAAPWMAMARPSSIPVRSNP